MCLKPHVQLQTKCACMAVVENAKMCASFKQIQAEKKIDLNDDAKWFRWVTKKETRTVKSEEKEITVTQKDEIQGKVGDLIDEFHSQLEKS